MFPTIVSYSTLRIGPYLFYVENFITQSKTTGKSDSSPYQNLLVFEKMTICLCGEVQS